MTTPGRWWYSQPLYPQIAAALDDVRTIDVHTHLLTPGNFRPELDASMPVRLRSSEPSYAAALTQRFGVAVAAGVGGLEAAAQEAQKVRAQMIDRLEAAGYWLHHLDVTRTEVALVNQRFADGTDGGRLRWVPHASDLIYPLPAQALMARSPKHKEDIDDIQAHLPGLLGEVGLADQPTHLEDYLRFIDATLVRWRERGAVAVKFWDAYLRTLLVDDVARDRAGDLYRKGRGTPLIREEYLALQDFLIRHIMLQAGHQRLSVHIHSSHGVPPFLRLQDCDVRNLEPVLADVRFFDTQFVLIHGGAPRFEEAAYLALKSHVWIDISAMPFLYAVPELAAVLRIYLRFAPEKVLFGTDVSGYPGVPVGPEVQHIALVRHTREALYLALAGMVGDGLVDVDQAISIGRGVLRDNAERHFGWGKDP